MYPYRRPNWEGQLRCSNETVVGAIKKVAFEPVAANADRQEPAGSRPWLKAD
jgi:hypothetical protein